jgi:energy-coupling factor transport system ATP-binding protein
MDSVSKENLGKILQGLAKEGKTIIIITHDTDFAADYSSRAVLMFGGRIVAEGDIYEIMPDAIYYTPQVARMFKGKCKVIKTYDAVKSLASGGAVIE